MASNGSVNVLPKEDVQIFNESHLPDVNTGSITIHKPIIQNVNTPQTIEVEETLSLQDKEIDMIKKALRKHKGKRKYAAKELGISERTLYRKINEYNIAE
jgi:transcriptional regulator with PAS, ATPase and Fis domain